MTEALKLSSMAKLAAKSPLAEIGFPEFTSKLITDVFDSLIAANIRQTEAYVELIQAVSKSLTEYINDTKDDISGDMILQYLARILPDSEKGTKVHVGATLTSTEVATLNSALTIKDVQDTRE